MPTSSHEKPYSTAGSQPTRISLLSRLRDDTDDQAWRDFEACYRDLILRYCRRSGLQQADAEDVQQIVMMGLARTLPDFRYDPSKGRFRAYLGRTVKNAIRRHVERHLPREETVHLGFDVAPPEPDDTYWDREWVLHHYRTAMRTVRATFEPRSVDVFDSLLAGSSVEAVAAGYGITAQAVHKIKQRIRNRLRDLITLQVREEDGFAKLPLPPTS